MTNLEAKQEAIKKAYGEYWEKLEYFINKNGWAYNFFEEIGIEIFGSEADFKNSIFWRPKSLQGIENNNGWIRIESDEDLPKDYVVSEFHLWLWTNNGIYEMQDYKRWNLYYDVLKVSHYRLEPIFKPNPPIY